MTPPQPPTRELQRRLGVLDATLLGIGAMVGAGVFVAWAPAARAAAGALLLALVLAGAVAFANATASAQLAAVYPRAGGTYVYAGERLGPTWGFLAGWAFVVGKTASCVVMAQAVARYAVADPGWTRNLLAVAVVAAITALNYFGVQRTALATRVLLGCSIAVLLGFVVAVWSSGAPAAATPLFDADDVSVRGLLQGAGIMFFAFAGYARIATMGEEVHAPAVTIPRAIQAALATALLIYLVVGVTLLHVLTPHQLANAARPLWSAADAAGHDQLHWVLGLGAALAAVGALLALMAGIGRTTFAMARAGDLPRALAAVHPRFGVPHRAELVLGALVAGLAVSVRLPSALGFSSFGVLLYYALANASALTQDAAARRWPRWIHGLGLIGCVVLAFSLPGRAVLAGLIVLALGLAYRGVHRRYARGDSTACTGSR